MDFVAIDFETANNYRTSACSLGMAIVKENNVVDTKDWLIKPEPYFFSDFNTAIHGIKESDVKNAPTFCELWPEIEPYINNNILAAHNASFDISVLRRSIEHYGICFPDIDILCSYRLSQAAFPDLWSHRLNIIAAHLNLSLNHHRADSDAEACANIICTVMKQAHISDLRELKKQYSLHPGYWKQGYYNPCRISCGCSSVSSKKFLDFSEAEKCIDEDFCDKNYAFTGTLLSMPREKAFEVVERGGGHPQKGLTQKTNVLVVGIQDYVKLRGASESLKMRKARELQEKGFPIRIIGEDEFIKSIDDDLYKLCFPQE